jgi:hypothetical protein
MDAFEIGATHPKNPFSLRHIESRAQFFGRKAETRQTLGFLRRGQCVSIVGPARIGKTSFLIHVSHPVVRAEHGLTEEQIFVYVDCHSLVLLTEGESYLHIREEVIRQIKHAVELDSEVRVQFEKTVRDVGSRTAHFELTTLLRSAQALKLKLIVVLDHLDTLNRSPLLGPDFSAALRSLHANFDLAYLVASQSPMHDLERVRPESSPFYNIFQQISLGPFTQEESRRLVLTLLNLAGAKFPGFVADHILKLGQNDPYRLQCAGHVAFQVWQENGENLYIEHCEEIRQRFEQLLTDGYREDVSRND